MSNQPRSLGTTGSKPSDPDGDNATAQGNYPPPGDTTSEGGYGPGGSAPFAPAAQRGLIDQSTGGAPLGAEMQDAYQGSDVPAQETYRHEQQQHGSGQGRHNPYSAGTLESRGEAEEKLASSIADTRGRQYESGPVASGDQDVGAQ